ncbi:MAG: DRTGG domain-containing protein [Anaerolineae bacterium]|nr:DRTGG domain-containing protein [Anaerolineae bacterium]
MTVEDVVRTIGLKVVTGQGALNREVTGGYASDLLSCVMARARSGNLWVTLQAHTNVVAVASLLELAAVIITEGVQPDPAACEKAEAEGVALLSSPETTFAVVARLAGLGIAAGS